MMVRTREIVLGGGCFWCLEAAFRLVPGVIDVSAGYAGGQSAYPTYREVTEGESGHAEVVKIVYEPSLANLEEILEIFFTIHDPTTKNAQGADVGPQYRSIILADSEKEKKKIQKFLKKAASRFENEIVTEVGILDKFYPAEEYHQRYFEKNPNAPYCEFVVRPKLEKVRDKRDEKNSTK